MGAEDVLINGYQPPEYQTMILVKGEGILKRRLAPLQRRVFRDVKWLLRARSADQYKPSASSYLRER